jgi:hypothetical protein
MTQEVECLPNMYAAVGSVPSTIKKKFPVHLIHTYKNFWKHIKNKQKA